MDSTFTDRVRRQVTRFGVGRTYTFLSDQAEPVSLDFAQLDHAARAVAAGLRARGLSGQCALLLYPPGLDFLVSFLGCLYAGVIAVPSPLPADARGTARLVAIVEDTGLSTVLTTAGLLDSLTGLRVSAELEFLTTDEAPLGDAAAWTRPEIDGDTVAFLQYTSGSTSEPKGVMVTHRNILSNERDIATLACIGEDLVLVGWLPHFHDMGLIGMLLQPLHAGGSCVFLSPTAFLKRPRKWLQAITDYRGTVTSAPNFAYDLCARVIPADQAARFDLSSLRTAISGAEPVRASTMSRFSAHFAAAGFREEAFAPSYGMAETTLIVTATAHHAKPTVLSVDRGALEANRIELATDGQGLDLVGCGRPEGLEVTIVDPATFEIREPGEIGEIWVRGPSVTAGYWRRPEVNVETFEARTADGSGPYLRTGDLGAFHDGELFVTGRGNDVLIYRGRNLYPQDIEHLVREIHPALAAGSGAVFGVVADGHDHMVVVQEVKVSLLDGRSLDDLVGDIRLQVARAFDIGAPSVVLTRRGAVQRTTSGKVKRGLTRTYFLDGRLVALSSRLGAEVAAAVTDGRDVPAHA